MRGYLVTFGLVLAALFAYDAIKKRQANKATDGFERD